MIDLKDFILMLISQLANPESEKATPEAAIQFLEDNAWFGAPPSFSNGSVMLSAEQAALFSAPLSAYMSSDSSSETLLTMLKNRFPNTAKRWNRFADSVGLSEDSRLYILDFLVHNLQKELSQYTDADMKALVSLATDDLTKGHGDTLTFFISWMKSKYPTRYFNEYRMTQRYSMEFNNTAYDMETYLQLLYYLFNEDYITLNDMYRRAAASKNYTDTWLFLSMHFTSALRLTDLERIYHPYLSQPPEDVLQAVADGTFSDNDARLVLLSITQRMATLPFTPNKTARYNDIASVKFHVPVSCEVHMGKLFALAEAHRQIAGTPDEPIIRKVSTYREINRYMGDDIGNLFLEADFRSRSATKSYLQAIVLLAEDIQAEEGGPAIKGYLLASLARSHKGSYGEYAAMTYEYLKDAALSGLKPEFVAYELLERGVLSFIPGMLLSTITGGEYKKLGAHQQTQMIQALDLTPLEVESLVKTVDTAQRQAELIVKDVVSSGTDVMTALHRIAQGQAFSKQPERLCLCTAINKNCAHETRQQCVGCEYEISTKSTLYLLIGEYNRLRELYQDTSSALMKEKYRKLITKVILPSMEEMLICLRENYGDEVFAEYETMIKENT